MKSRRTAKNDRTVTEMDFHRNGVGGLPFHVAIVREQDGDDVREMLVVRFDDAADEQTGQIVCAAFDLRQLDKRVIKFGHNSWRGDHYADIVDAEVAKRKL